jgi:hypothetical protein
VSNAVSVEATKFISYLGTIRRTVDDPISTATNFLALKNIIQGASTTTAIITGGSSVGPGN